MNPRHVIPSSVRPERTTSRAGLWALQPVQLQLPFEATGLSERIQATGRLQVTPDYDVFAWLCERWLRQPTETGWMRPTFYEIGSALYDRPPTGEDYRVVRDSLDRLAGVLVTIDGYDGEKNELADRIVFKDNLVALGRPADEPVGSKRVQIRLAEWLRVSLEKERVARLPWRVLRAFSHQQTLAKRLWVYLAAERWKVEANGWQESTWLVVDERLFAALGMSDKLRAADARIALKKALRAIRETDPRYAAGALVIEKMGRSWRLLATRTTWAEYKASHPDPYALPSRQERDHARAMLRRQLG